MADDLFCDDGDVAVFFMCGADDPPVDFWHICGDAAVDLAAEELQNLGMALFEPGCFCNDSAAVVEQQRVWKAGVGIGLGFVVVDGVGRVWGGADARAQLFDVQKIEEALVILFGGELHGGRRCSTLVGLGWHCEARCKKQDGGQKRRAWPEQ